MTPATAEDFTSEPDAPTPEVQAKPYDPEPEREKKRGQMAIGLLALLASVIVGSFLSLWFKWAGTDDLLKVLNVVFGSLIGLVGAVTGFYYGSAGGRSSRGT